MPEKYYLEKLYPLQDGVMKIVNALNTPFYLTGGTALSRHYFQHRYSDDLDLFVNNNESYASYVQMIISELTQPNTHTDFSIDMQSLRKGEYYTQFFVKNPDPSGTEILLKMDLINDIAARFGPLSIDPALGKIDNWRNILSNKLSALFRFEAKDVVDLLIIARNRSFNWQEIIWEAKSKEAGIDPLEIHHLLTSFPISELEYIKWIKPPNHDTVTADLNQIAKDILLGQDNSLQTEKV